MSGHERAAILRELLGRKVRVVLDSAIIDVAWPVWPGDQPQAVWPRVQFCAQAAVYALAQEPRERFDAGEGASSKNNLRAARRALATRHARFGVRR